MPWRDNLYAAMPLYTFQVKKENLLYLTTHWTIFHIQLLVEFVLPDL
jgi:uncharacterized protein YhbP (UPF0306 family)